MNPPSKAVGIKEIAKELGVSIGTVDRALHDRKGVDAKTKAMVLKVADRMNYRPNLAARRLKLNRRLRIAVCSPAEVAAIFDLLRDGIREAAAALTGIEFDLDFRTFPRLGDGDLQVLEEAVDRHYDGLLLTPGNPKTLEPTIRRISSSGTAVICVASDAPRSGRLTSVSIDPGSSGGIAAELLGRCVQSKSVVATITGDLSICDHREKLAGFAAALATIAPHLTMLPAMETHDRPQEAYRATVNLLRQKPTISGLYVSTANCLPVITALKEQDLLKRVAVVTTDLFPDLAALIESGDVMATLYQRPFAVGRVALEMLVRHLLEGVPPQPVIHLAPQIVLRSNLHLFHSHITGYSNLDEIVPGL